MGLRINQNVSAMNAYRNLSVTDGQMSKSLEKLSSGFRINRAADDAAGLSISEGLRSQVGGLKVAVRNAQDGVNVVQTADGALNETTAILQRMRDLAVQAANGGSQDTNAQSAADTEFKQLSAELDRIANTTGFGSQKLLDGTYNGTFQVGANNTANDQITIKLDATAFGTAVSAAAATSATNVTTDNLKADFSSSNKTFTVAGKTVTLNTDLSAATDTAIKTAIDAAFTSAGVTGVTTAVSSGKLTLTSTGTGVGSSAAVATTGLTSTVTDGADAVLGSATGFTAAKLGLGSATLTGSTTAAGVTNARDALARIDNALKGVSTARATLGAAQNRFEHTINNLNVAVENLSASESQIRDTDMAQEMTKFTRSQILQQAGTSMLAQANSSQQSVLKLLG